MSGSIRFPFRPCLMTGRRDGRDIAFGVAAFTVLVFAPICCTGGRRIDCPIGTILVTAVVILTDIGQYLIRAADLHTG